MLDVLCRVEAVLSEMLEGPGWNSLYVDYHPPIVERVWREWSEGHRVYLHRIHPCEKQEALFHPHPWPSAMRVLSSAYEMAVVYGKEMPPVAARIILTAHSAYEMVDMDSWHSVRPIDGPSLSLMVTGPPWNRPSPKSKKPLNPLPDEQKEEIIAFFREYYATVEPCH